MRSSYRLPQREGALDQRDSNIGEGNVSRAAIDGAVNGNAEAADQLIGRDREGAFVVIVAAGDYERNARFVDQNRIGLVDDGRGERALDLVRKIERQTVAQKIEADFVGRGVEHVARVGDAALVR